MRVLFLGAGAIGGYYGARLIEGGAHVSFLVRPRRLEQLQNQGLVVESPAYGNVSTAAFTAFTEDATSDQPPFDLVVLTCKAYDLDGAMDSIAPFVAKGATVLPLLNGLAHLEKLNSRFGKTNVLGGLAKIAAVLRSDGVIQHLNDWRYITFGTQDGSPNPRAILLKEAFDRTSVKATLVDDVNARMWEKFVHLATVASMTCLMRASVGEIAQTPTGTRLLTRTFDILVSMSEKAGYPISASFKKEYYELFADKSSGYKASMLRDIEKGGKIEADHIVGYAVEQATKFEIEAPPLDAAYTSLKIYEQRQAAGQS